MKRRLSYSLCLCFVMLLSCTQNTSKQSREPAEPTSIIAERYELHLPSQDPQAVLILFGGYPEVATDIKREFEILEIAMQNNIAVLFSNFNQKLWLEEDEKEALASHLKSVIAKHQLPTDQVFIGGFSSGGVVSLHISNYLIGSDEYMFKPKGIFAADSPIDLSALYTSSEKNIRRNFSETSVNESWWLISKLGNALGNPHEDLKPYEDRSVYTLASQHTNNLQHLKDIKIRLYTEPDTIWWRENRMADYDQLNAYYLLNLSKQLQKLGYEQVEYIPTINKGYRASGDRHPHSWSIIYPEALIQWILSD